MAQLALITGINEAIGSLPKYTAQELREMGRSKREIEQYLAEAQRNKGQQAQAAGAGAAGQAGIANRGSIHAMVTSNGNPYMNWQSEIMYHTFLKVWPQSSQSWGMHMLL